MKNVILSTDISDEESKAVALDPSVRVTSGLEWGDILPHSIDRASVTT